MGPGACGKRRRDVDYCLAVVHSHVFEPRVWDALVQIGDRTVDASFPITLGKGIAAGWLIALMMWLLQAPDSSRVHIIIIMTYVLAICEFSHNVAGALDCAFMAQIGHVSLRDYVGTTLVALLYYGQVAAEIQKPRDRT